MDIKHHKEEEEERPTLNWHASRYKVHKLCQRYALNSHLACEQIQGAYVMPKVQPSTLTWHASKYKVNKSHQRYIPDVCIGEDVHLVTFMYIVFTCMPGESDRRRLRSLLLCSCDVFDR